MQERLNTLFGNNGRQVMDISVVMKWRRNENDHVELEEINAINNKMLISEFLFPEVKRKEWEVEGI